MVINKIRAAAKSFVAGTEIHEDDYVEVGFLDSKKRTGKIGIKIDSLNEFGDTERVLRNVREGTIIFLKIKALKEKDLGELKRAVDKLKRTVIAQNGDIAGVEQEWLIISPHFAAVHRD